VRNLTESAWGIGPNSERGRTKISGDPRRTPSHFESPVQKKTIYKEPVKRKTGSKLIL